MKSIIAILFLSVISQNTFAKIYKCNINGQSTYQGKPCLKSSGKEIKTHNNKSSSSDYIHINEILSNSEGLSLLDKIPKLKFKKRDSYSREDVMKFISSLGLAGSEASGCKIEVSIYYSLNKDDCKRLFGSYLVPYYEANYHLNYILKNNKKYSPDVISYIDNNLEKINRKTEYFQKKIIPLKQILQRNL